MSYLTHVSPTINIAHLKQIKYKQIKIHPLQIKIHLLQIKIQQSQIKIQQLQIKITIQ